MLSSLTEESSAKGPASTSTPPPPFSAFSAFNSAPSTSQNNTPQPFQSAFQPPAAAAAAPSSDPFAALASSNFSSQPAQPAAPKAADDDEWNFSSALPTETPALPREHKAVVANTGLKIDLLANRTTSASNSINLLFAFSNNTAQPISEVHFQLAVTKVGLMLFR